VGYYYLLKRGGVWQVVIEIDVVLCHSTANHVPTPLNTTRQHVSPFFFFFFWSFDLLCLILFPTLATDYVVYTYLPTAVYTSTHPLTHSRRAIPCLCLHQCQCQCHAMPL
jgi:hypothetical protein